MTWTLLQGQDDGKCHAFVFHATECVQVKITHVANSRAMTEGKGTAQETAAAIPNRVYTLKQLNDSLEKEIDDGYSISDSELQPDTRQGRTLLAIKRVHGLRLARQQKVNGARGYPLLRKNRTAVSTKWHFI